MNTRRRQTQARPRKHTTGIDYQKYLASSWWKEVRDVVIEQVNGICERCGKAPVSDVHHASYERLGMERREDLLALCRPCHEFLHGKRKDDPRFKTVSEFIDEMECRFPGKKPIGSDLFPSCANGQDGREHMRWLLRRMDDKYEYCWDRMLHGDFEAGHRGFAQAVAELANCEEAFARTWLKYQHLWRKNSADEEPGE